MKQEYYQIKKILNDIEVDVDKFCDKGNLSAGVRVRKAMQEVKVIAQDIRKEVLSKKKI